jgi:molybdate transport system regulatory protein
MIKVKSKIWLEKDGELVFGEGRYELLKALDETGSIRSAAEKLDMPYKKAWSYLSVIEKRLNIKFIDKKRGGVDGGNSVLTKEGKEFLKKYEEFKDGLKIYIENKFLSIFENK